MIIKPTFEILSYSQIDSFICIVEICYQEIFTDLTTQHSSFSQERLSRRKAKEIVADNSKYKTKKTTKVNTLAIKINISISVGFEWL